MGLGSTVVLRIFVLMPAGAIILVIIRFLVGVAVVVRGVFVVPPRRAFILFVLFILLVGRGATCIAGVIPSAVAAGLIGAHLIYYIHVHMFYFFCNDFANLDLILTSYFF